MKHTSDEFWIHVNAMGKWIYKYVQTQMISPLKFDKIKNLNLNFLRNFAFKLMNTVKHRDIDMIQTRHVDSKYYPSSYLYSIRKKFCLFNINVTLKRSHSNSKIVG